MKLSVIIPTKNEERHLPILLRQLSAQSRVPDEVIVADADSEDRTVEIAMKLGAKVVQGGLPGIGRNAGASVANGDVLLFLDADVTFHDKMQIEKSLAQFTDRELDIATTDVFPEKGTKYDHFSHWVYNTYVRALARMSPHAPGFFILVHRDLHEEIGGFDETIFFCEDHDYAKRAAKLGTFGILSKLPIHVSIRRMDRDGRFAIAVKFLLAELHLIFLGPIRHKKFRYTFGHPVKKYGRKK
jgi:glycosyltransferase involved in cell wall biosynthesis